MAKQTDFENEWLFLYQLAVMQELTVMNKEKEVDAGTQGEVLK